MIQKYSVDVQQGKKSHQVDVFAQSLFDAHKRASAICLNNSHPNCPMVVKNIR